MGLFIITTFPRFEGLPARFVNGPDLHLQEGRFTPWVTLLKDFHDTALSTGSPFSSTFTVLTCESARTVTGSMAQANNSRVEPASTDMSMTGC